MIAQDAWPAAIAAISEKLVSTAKVHVNTMVARKNRRTLTAAKRSVALCLQEADQARETFVRHFQSVSTTVMIEHTRMLDSLIQHIRELQQNMCSLDLPE